MPNRVKLPISRCLLAWITAAAGGTLLLVAIGLVVVFSGHWVDRAPLTHSGAVATMSPICANIGRDILKRNGSAVDAAIAILFCEEVSMPISLGIGGGLMAVIYSAQDRKAEALIARETAPAASRVDMFVGEIGVKGIKAVAVPGQLKGFGAMHARYGRLPWADILQPAIAMCRNGFPITPFLNIKLESFSDLVRDSPVISEVYWNAREKRVAQTGEMVKRPRLADTFEAIAREGPQSMYTRNGTVAQRLIKEIDDLGGIITMRDLEEYRVRWERPETARVLGDKMLYSTPLPASGSLLVFIINFLNGFLPESLGWSTTFHHRIIEAFKYAYARRTHLGDPQFVEEAQELVRNLTDREYAQQLRAQVTDERTYDNVQHYGADFSSVDDHGTAHISVLAPNGDAVSVTSSINAVFGSQIMTPTTGFILNDVMDDFSTPGITNGFGLEASPANNIAPGKMPLSSMCPTIIVDAKGNVEMVVGGAGGTMITTSVSWFIVAHLMRNKSLEDTMRAARLHHQLLPMQITYEAGFDALVLHELAALGHVLKVDKIGLGLGAVSAISRKNGVLSAVCDYRRNGSVALV